MRGGQNMILVQLMKPFYTRYEGESIKMVFAYQYFSIRKDDELFHFIPVEGKEIILNAKTLQVENLSEVFVFQKGNRFIRLPLYQLLLVSDIHIHLQTILEEANQVDTQGVTIEGADEVIKIFEQQNLERMIDFALSTKDESLFYSLLEDKEI